MNKFASFEVDFHDNPALLDQTVAAPEFVKSAAVSSRDDVDASKYAVVMLVGGRTMPKFALHNKAHVWLANEIFPKTAARLPERARQVAAHFIKRACFEYKIPAHAAVLRESDCLEKIAGNVYDAGCCDDQSALDYDKYRIGWRGQFPADLLKDKLAEFVRQDTDEVVSAQEVGETLASRLYAYAMQEGYSLPAVGTMTGALPEGLKNKSEIGSFFKDRIAVIEESEKTKHASAAVDAHNYKAGSFGVLAKTASGTIGLFPMHDAGMIKQAIEYFTDNRENMAPKYRHEMASGIIKNATAAGVHVQDPLIRAYASDVYSPNLGANLQERRALMRSGIDKAAEQVLNELEAIQDRLPAQDFAQALENFDKQAGIDRHWGRGIKDPWLSTFEYVKKASWSWASGDDEVTEAQLIEFASKHAESLRGYVSQNIITELQRHPVEIFDSLPRPEKEIIAARIEEAGL